MKFDKVFIIADIADNHLGNVDLAKSMIDSAKECGVDAVKFQYHIPEKEMVKESVLNVNHLKSSLYAIIEKNKLTFNDHCELKSYCDNIGITYLCTPFSLDAAIELFPLISMYKIGSGEFTDLPTLEIIAKLGKPMILSTGMSSKEEIKMVFDKLYPINKNLVLMNCTSEYPPDYEDINLSFINELIETYKNVIIGHSDHTPDIYTSLAAVSFGAKVIEKHFILDKRIPGPDKDVSLNSQQLKELVDGVRKIEKAMTKKEKQVYDKEKSVRNWARRSLVAITDIKKGELLTTSNIWSKRPGYGIPSFRMSELLMKHAKRDINKDSILSTEDFE